MWFWHRREHIAFSIWWKLKCITVIFAVKLNKYLYKFDFCVSMHHHIWVLLGPALCKLFCAVFIKLSALHVSNVIHIHPQERYKMYMQMVQVSTFTICMYILYRSWGWMCITSETCRANSVIKTALNNLHQVGPNKTHNLFSVSCLQYAQRQRSRTSELITIRCAFFNFI